MRAAGLLLLPLVLAGCAEMRTPPPAPPPADLVADGSRPGSRVDPVRASILAADAAFADSGLSLAGRPAEAAQAAAQLEYLAVALLDSDSYRAMREGVRRELLLARDELRGALGISETADPRQVMRALLASARALRAGQAEAAAAALPAGMFRPGGAGSLRRFGEPGPLPQAARASALAREELARLDSNQLWLQGRSQDGISMEIGTTGSGMFPGLGSGF